MKRLFLTFVCIMHALTPCFAAVDPNTLIHVEGSEEYIPLKQLQPGTRVYSMSNPTTTVINWVKKVGHKRFDKHVKLRFAGLPEGEYVICSHDTKFYLYKEKTWCKAEDLLPSVAVLCKGGKFTYLLTKQQCTGVAHELASAEIVDHHNFCITRQNIVVHNVAMIGSCWFSYTATQALGISLGPLAGVVIVAVAFLFAQATNTPIDTYAFEYGRPHQGHLRAMQTQHDVWNYYNIPSYNYLPYYYDAPVQHGDIIYDPRTYATELRAYQDNHIPYFQREEYSICRQQTPPPPMWQAPPLEPNHPIMPPSRLLKDDAAYYLKDEEYPPGITIQQATPLEDPNVMPTTPSSQPAAEKEPQSMGVKPPCNPGQNLPTPITHTGGNDPIVQPEKPTSGCGGTVPESLQNKPLGHPIPEPRRGQKLITPIPEQSKPEDTYMCKKKKGEKPHEAIERKKKEAAQPRPLTEEEFKKLHPNGKFKGASYHPNGRDSGRKSAAPTDGQASLDHSIQCELEENENPNTTRRLSVVNKEFVVLDETCPGEFHGHVRTWKKLTDKMQSALKKANLVTKKGKIK